MSSIPVSVLRANGFIVEPSKTSPGNTSISREKPFAYYKANEVQGAEDIYDSKVREFDGKPRHEVVVRHDYTLTDSAEVPITIVSPKEKAVLLEMAAEYEKAASAAYLMRQKFIDRVHRRHLQPAATTTGATSTGTASTGATASADDEAAEARARAERIMEECGA